MPLIHSFYPLLRPLLFKLDAETAHEWTVKMMRAAHFIGLLPSQVSNPKSETEVFGLKFPNLAGLAAGMDKSASAVDAWLACGFGFVEVGTLTPRPQPGNPTPRLFRLIEKRAIINRMGFNNPGIESAVERLRKRQGNGGIVGVNIGKNFDTPNENAVDDYLKCLRAAYEVADYIAVNISSPNTKGLRDLQAEEPVRRLVATLKEEQSKLATQHGKRVPLLVKIAPDLDPSQIESLARVFAENALDGMIATNTTITRTGVEDHPISKETGGLSGAPLTTRATEVISAFRSLLPKQIPIIGVGGIMNGDDAKAKLAAGASLLQVYTGLIYRGPKLISEIANITAS